VSREPRNGRHLGFFAQCRYVADDPFRLVSVLSWLDFGIVDPGGLEFPSRRELECVVNLAPGDFALKSPDVLQHHRLLFLFVFVADNVAGIRRGNLQQLVFNVRNEFAARNARKRDLDGFFVFDFVVFALRRDAPAAKRCDLAVRVEGNAGDTIIPAAGAKDFISQSNVGFHFVDGLDGDYLLGIKQHGVGFFVVRRDRGGRSGVHPCGSVARSGGRRGQGAKE
jgi:hypothetical protein